MNKARLSFWFVILFFLSGNVVIAADLNDIWIYSDGEITISQDGQYVKGFITKLSTVQQGDSFYKTGDLILSGTFDGQKFMGKLHTHFIGLEFKTLCPSQWNRWKNIEMTLSDNGNSLIGREEISSIDNSCNVTSKGWDTATPLYRKYPLMNDISDSDGGGGCFINAVHHK